MGVMGVIGFFVAIFRPHLLPGRNAAEREEEERERKQHQSQLDLDGKRASAKLRRDFFSFGIGEGGQRHHTEALNLDPP